MAHIWEVISKMIRVRGGTFFIVSPPALHKKRLLLSSEDVLLGPQRVACVRLGFELQRKLISVSSPAAKVMICRFKPNIPACLSWLFKPCGTHGLPHHAPQPSPPTSFSLVDKDPYFTSPHPACLQAVFNYSEP